jgi:hypothetical protein
MVWASMSIGGGELVLIPRVGSVFGIVVLWMPLLAIALKYFMLNEIGRWTLLTGRSISDGFALLPGPRHWLNWIILVVAIYLGTVHIGGLVAMVGAITYNMFPFLPPFGWSLILMLSFIALMWTGKYDPLELVMKVGLATTYEGDRPGMPVERLKTLDRGVLERVAAWQRVMFHDNLWAGNFPTILVTAAFMLDAIVILHPQKLPPAGTGFILTLSKTYTQTLGAWAYWIYMIGAWAVIYGTRATCYDGYARLINRTILICLPKWEGYARIDPTWRYRIWMLYGTIPNFVLVYLLSAVQFLQAAAGVEGTFLLPVVAQSIACLTSVILPRLFPADAGGPYRPRWIFPADTVAAAALYIILIVMLLRY